MPPRLSWNSFHNAYHSKNVLNTITERNSEKVGCNWGHSSLASLAHPAGNALARLAQMKARAGCIVETATLLETKRHRVVRSVHAVRDNVVRTEGVHDQTQEDLVLQGVERAEVRRADVVLRGKVPWR